MGTPAHCINNSLKEFLRVLIRRLLTANQRNIADSVDQDQFAQNVQSNLGSTVSVREREKEKIT